METFSALLVICAGNSPVSGEFPTQRPVTRIFDIFFDLRLMVGLRRHRAHYDVNLINSFPTKNWAKLSWGMNRYSHVVLY